MTKLNQILAALLFGILFGTLMGCSQELSDDANNKVYFSPFKNYETTPQIIEFNEKPLVNAEELQRYKPLIDAFSQNASEHLQRADIGNMLEQFERMYILSGRYFEIVSIYQKDFDTRGLQSPAAPRLAWAYMQLGQKKLARNLIDQLKSQQSDNAMSWMLDGAYWIDDAESSVNAAARTIQSWTKALELNPTFPEFKGLNALAMRQRIEFLKQRYPELKNTEQPLPTDVQNNTDDSPVDDSPTDVQNNTDDSPVDDSPTDVPAPASAPLLIAQGQVAASSGQRDKAHQYFLQALKLEPENVVASLAMLRLTSQMGMSTKQLNIQAEKIAEIPHITVRQTYDLGIFALNTLNNKTLALKLFESVAANDKDMAARLNIDALIKRAQD